MKKQTFQVLHALKYVFGIDKEFGVWVWDYYFALLAIFATSGKQLSLLVW
jgi:hypothetical protein